MYTYGWHSRYSGYGNYLTKTVKILIAVNVGFFILINIVRIFPWLAVFGLVPADVFGRLRLWQLFTYMFLHAGLWHLLINMLMLWFFGPAIENAWGRRQFLSYYFFTGIGAGLCSFLTAARSTVPVIGASGAIFGILVAYALRFPDTVVLLFFFFPMRIRQALMLLVGVNLLGALSAPNAGIAYFAHMGGGLCGYLYLKSEWLRRKVAYWHWPDFAGRVKARAGKNRQLQQQRFNQKVDAILGKVSKYGIDSLTKEEKRVLEQRSKK